MPRYQQVVRQWWLLRRMEGSGARGIAVSELAEQQGLSERSVYRDLDALQQAGFPIFAGTVDGRRRWMLTEGFRQGGGVPIPLSEVLALRCARSALEALQGTPFHEGLRGLIAKLDSLLTPEMQTFARAMDEAFVGDRFGRPACGDPLPYLEVLRQAMAEGRSVQLRYKAQSGQVTERRVDPYHIWIHRSVLYLVGWCHLREEVRTLSMARVQELSLVDERFTSQPGYDFDTFRRERFRIWAEGPPRRVRILFSPQAAAYVSEREWHPSQKLQETTEGGVLLEMETSGMTELCTWVMSFGPRARVLEPEELAHRVREELQAALKGYEEGEGRGEGEGG